MKCPVCYADQSHYYLKEVDRYRIYKCSDCGVEYTDPMPSNEALSEFYSDYFDIRAEEDVVALNAQKNIADLENKGFLKLGDRVLDFGCGSGIFVQQAKETYDVTGYDPFLVNTCDYLVNDVAKIEGQFDVITLWGVLEHLTDLESFKAFIHQFLKPEGCIVITTVDAESTIPYYYKPPEHTLYWTKKGMTKLASQTQCQIVDYHPYEMMQRASIYLDRLLSRTPEPYRTEILEANPINVDYVKVPTNEVWGVMKRSTTNDLF